MKNRFVKLKFYVIPQKSQLKKIAKIGEKINFCDFL